MRISIASFHRGGKTPFADSEGEYVTRLSRHATVDLVALRAGKDAGLPARLVRSAHVIGLFPDGRCFNSEAMAARLGALMTQGQSQLVFVIGGPEGMPPGAAVQVAERWSLSPLTFSHQLARLVLLEALYRSYDILQGGRRYHK